MHIVRVKSHNNFKWCSVDKQHLMYRLQPTACLYSKLSLLQAQAAVSSAHNRAAELESELESAVAARDEFVYHLSPQKQRPPLPLGSPAPRANKAQLTAALKVGKHPSECKQCEQTLILQYCCHYMTDVPRANKDSSATLFL